MSITNYKNAIELNPAQRVEFLLDQINYLRPYKTDLSSLCVELRESLVAAKNDFSADERQLQALNIRIQDEKL